MSQNSSGFTEVMGLVFKVEVVRPPGMETWISRVVAPTECVLFQQPASQARADCWSLLYHSISKPCANW